MGDERVVKGNTGDWSFVKTTLDTQILKIVEEDYDVDKSLMNLKLVMGYIAIAFALLAQFYPMKWPDSWWLTAVCVFVYTSLSSIMQLMIWYYNMDNTLTKPTGKSDPHGMCFSSELPRFSDNFTIRISSRGGKDSNGKVQELEATESISKWFDKDGVFYPDQFEPFVRNLLDTWESKAARKEE
eukprot:c5775_g1_i2.p1 GENE.c5775_g1_i2~~c5775_g1_i2.p1  ORF type:complete len:198 (+),score=47.57 c5775_g1_i2:45-596(+)